jgi:hypothetical protein
MPSVAAAPVAGIGYGTATAPARARFAPVSAASGGLIVANTIRTLTVSGTDVGSVGVFRIKPGLGASPMFQDQFVVQVMNAVAGKASAPKFVRIDGQVVALATGPAAVAGWFEGDRVVLVYRNGGRPDLNSLALAVKNAPAGRSLPAPAPTPPAE